jgi:transcriptional regulator with XRE-family HTH domain
MGRSSAPPVNAEAIRQARIRRCLTQARVQELCAERGAAIDRGNLSRIERGLLRWPAPDSIPVLAEVLGLTMEEIFEVAA